MLNTLIASCNALALNMCRTRDGMWQASLEVSRGTFRIGYGHTPEEAVADLMPIVSRPPY